jgi:hypothetical protein
MRAHQLIAVLPVKLAVRRRADGRQWGITAKEMERIITLLLDALDGIGHAADSQLAGVARLASAARIESRAIEDDGTRFSFDGNNYGIEFLQVTVGLIEQVGHGFLRKS